MQEHHTAIERHAADAGFRKAEARRLHRNDDIAAEHHLEAAAQCVAVDAGDDGHVERATERKAAEAVFPADGPVIDAGTTAAALEVGACTKSLFA